MWKAFKARYSSCTSPLSIQIPLQVGLVPTDLYEIDEPDDSMKNAKRFERLWEEEKRRCHVANVKKDKKTPLKPSLSRVAWQFGRTRFILSLTLVVLSSFFQFVGPVSQQMQIL